MSTEEMAPRDGDAGEAAAAATVYRLKRGEQEYQIRGLARLQEAARIGRVVPSDYVFNPVLERWMYARDMAELQGQLGAVAAQKESKQGHRTAWMLFLLSILCGLLINQFVGVVLFIVAIVVAVMASAKARKA